MIRSFQFTQEISPAQPDTDADTCTVVLSADGKQAFSETLNSHQSVDPIVDLDAEVTDRWIVR